MTIKEQYNNNIIQINELIKKINDLITDLGVNFNSNQAWALNLKIQELKKSNNDLKVQILDQEFREKWFINQ
jgi:predicted  nucleic acid-binding Zn-ribbon protein